MADNSSNQNPQPSDSIDLGPPTEAAKTESGTQFSVEGAIEEGATYAVVDPISTRDIAIAGVGLIVAMVLFFMLKRTFELWCVNRRVAPNKAKLAGTMLFAGLTLLSVAVALYFLSPVKFGVALFMGPLLSLSAAALAMAAFNARK